MPAHPGADEGRGPPPADSNGALAADLEASAAVAERMAAEREADGRLAFAARRRALARRLRARAAAHRRAASGAGRDRA
jgi:hypothetical protein